MAGKYYYKKEAWHKGLNKYRVVKAESNYELNQKIRALMAQWDEQWERKCDAEEKKSEKEKILRSQQEALKFADEMTMEAEKVQEKLDNILFNSLKPKPLDVNKLKDFTDYPNKAPKKPVEPVISKEPNLLDEKYNPKVPFLVKISKKKYEDFKVKIENDYKDDLLDWEKEKKQKESKYEKELKSYNEKLEQWKKERDSYKEKQSYKNEEIDKFIMNFNNGKSDAIAEYYSTVINQVEKPFDYDCFAEAEYNPQNEMLIMDILLPTIEDLPKLKKVTYVKSNGEYKESYHTDAYMKKKYDSVIYQIVLQTLNYIFKIDDEYNYVESIVLNGKVSTIDKTTGKNIVPYILSLNISKNDFNGLNLSAIDPKSWFKSAKGISAATFANVTPVAPVVLMSREDDRFIDGYVVTNKLDETINLAAINWQDFENLIREIFEQEFNNNGGEVKITQASRDGGVDAIAFDPDPIRGGKIVIQAKRYTNVVGVSAVRDLYGTVMNEGATKGILVTTSNYGNDAYDFASGKPITLMNGANLLYLLEKHGHKARIDLKEAKELLNDEK